MGAFVVEFLAEGVEAPLLGGAVARRWARGLGLESPVHALVSPILLRLTGLDEPDLHGCNAFGRYRMNSGRIPSRTQKADSEDRRASVVVAKGTPLSV